MSESPSESRGSDRRWRPVAGFVAGLILLAAAVWAVASQDISGVWHAVATRARWVALVGVLALADWLLMSEVFHVLMKPYGVVSRREMRALIGASWLLNYLPMRPGLLGRVAYHKAVNGIAVADSARVVAANIGCGFVAMGLGVLVALAPRIFGAPGAAVTVAAALAPAVLIAAPLAAGLLRRPHLSSWGLAALLRYVDLWVWAARYFTIFRVLGHEIDPGQALAVAVVSQAAGLVPLFGNGLGLREWAVGLTAASLPVWMSGSGDLGREAGLAADLVNRAAEVAAAVPVGLAGAWWLARRRAAPANPETSGLGPQ